MRIAFNPSTVEALIAPPNNKDITFDLRGHNIFARGVKFCGTDTNTWRDIKINNVSIDSNILDLRDGDNTTLTNINGVVTINSTWRPVVDNLTSDSTTSSLSANLGRILKALIDGKSNSGHTHDDRYLKLTGGTMQLGEGLKFHADNNYFGTNEDARIISLLDGNDTVCNGGLIIDERATYNGTEYVTELLRIRDSEFKWKGSNILHSGNSNINGNTITINGSSLNVIDLKVTLSFVSSGYTDFRAVLITAETSSGSAGYTPSTVTGQTFITNALQLSPQAGNLYLKGSAAIGTTNFNYKLNVNGDIGLLNTGSIRDLTIGGGIYWNPYVELTTDSSDAASITLVRLGVAGGTTLVLSLMNDANDTILFQTNGSAKLYHNSYPILTSLNTFVNNNKGYIYGNEITLVNNADTVDGYHASAFAAASHTHPYLPLSGAYITGTNIADMKVNIRNYFSGKPAGTNCYVGSPNIIYNFLNDSAACDATSICGIMALNPGYDNYNHGHFLVSHYGDNRIGMIGLGYSTWYGPNWFAYTSDIPIVTDYYWANVKVSASSSTSTSPIFGSATINTRLSIAPSTLTKTYPTNLQLVINGPYLDSSVTPGLKDWPGIGFYMPGRTWGSLIFDGNITAINSDYNGYVNYYGAGFRKNGSSDSYVLLGGGGHYSLDNILHGDSYGTMEGTISDCNSVDRTGIYSSSGFSNRPSGIVNWGTLFNLRLHKSNNLYHRQLFFDCYASDRICTRSNNGGSWTSWKELITSANISSQSVNYANSAGNADTVDGYHASDFASSSHSHNYAANENYGGFTKSGRLPISGFYQSNESESGGNAPWSSLMHLINCLHSNPNNNFALLIAASFFDNNTFKIRVTNDSVNNAWRDIIHSGNIGSLLVKGAYIATLTLDVGTLIRSGYLASDYTNRYNTLEYMKAAAKYLLKNYSNLSVFGTMVPNSLGFFTANIYGDGFNSNGNPEHITIHYYPHGGNIINCGTSYGNWYWNSVSKDEHTHSWQSITDKIVGGNEFNIVNAGFNGDMWFNYVPINDRSKTATISYYCFGNGQGGYASVTASGFAKNGSSSSYVLLGDGGHQTISSLSVNYANSAGNADTLDNTHLNGIFTAFGNNAHNITATIGGVTKSFLVNWAADSDKLDGYHENSFLRYRGDTSTNLEATLWNLIGIKLYNNALPDNLTGVYNYGSVISLPGSSSRFEIYASHLSSNGNGLYYRSGWGSDKKTWLKFIDSSNIGSQSVNYANSAGNADKLDGIHANGLLTSVTNTNNGISVTVGGTTKSVSNISVNYASSAGNATSATNAYHLRINSADTWSTWYWAGLSGQPSWLWGSNDGTNMYVWNPSNFSVNYANSAGNADTTDGVHIKWAGELTSTSHLVAWEADGSALRDINPANVSVGYASSAGNADTVDGYHASKFPYINNSGVWKVYGNSAAAALADNTAGLSSWAFGESRNYGITYLGILKPSTATCGISVDGTIAIFGQGDTHLGIASDYGSANLQVFGGNADKIVWRKKVAFTSDIPTVTNYYWANVKISDSSSTTTSPTVSNLTATDSIRMGNISLEHTDKINNSANGGLHLNYRSSGNVSLCQGGGNVGIGTTSPSYRLEVNGLMRASGFHHSSMNSDNYILLAGGGYERIFKLSKKYDDTSYELSFHKLSGLCNNLVWVDGSIWNSTSTSFYVSSDFYPFLYANSSSMRTIYRMDENNMITIDGNGRVVISCSSYPRRVGFFYTGRA